MEQLEEHIAHLQRMVDEMSEVVATQSDNIARLERQVTMLMQREAEREAEAPGGVVIGDERPPHY